MHLSRLACVAVFSVLPAVASAQGYINLLGDPSLPHWINPNGDAVSGGWILEPDGSLHLQGKGGNIITRQQYGDFELWFEFRIADKGNSGIKYRVTKYGNALLGCEYQILDDSAFPKLDRKNLTASLYDVIPTIPEQTRRNPQGEFNVGKIVVRNNRIQHWVNGQLTVDECVGSPAWDDYIAHSKFSNKDNFGENQTGHIMLTDHGSEVWYRNVFIRPLSPVSCPEWPAAQTAQDHSAAAVH